MAKITIYTDGACFPNPGNGGWAAIILRHDAKPEYLSGSENGTTNNQMEIQGAIEGLRRTEPGDSVLAVLDAHGFCQRCTTLRDVDTEQLDMFDPARAAKERE